VDRAAARNALATLSRAMSTERRAPNPFVQLAQRRPVATFVSMGAVVALVLVVLGRLNVFVGVAVGLAFTLLHLYLWRPGGIARRTQGSPDDGPINWFGLVLTLVIIAATSAISVAVIARTR
jgi:hypothetical protein